MPINIVIVSLSEKFAQSVSSSLSKKLDMLMVDCHEMIVYDLINPQEVIEKAGLEYFKKREKSVIKNCAEFLNTVISIGYNLFVEYKELFKNSLVFYIHIPKKTVDEVVNQIAFEDRNEKIKDFTNLICLEKRSSSEAVKKILEKMGEIYENC